jgi:hypothetical protein
VDVKSALISACWSIPVIVAGAFAILVLAATLMNKVLTASRTQMLLWYRFGARGQCRSILRLLHHRRWSGVATLVGNVTGLVILSAVSVWVGFFAFIATFLSFATGAASRRHCMCSI